jgi:ketosteroid isomerase-like protein
MPEDSHIRLVRALWEAIREGGGIEAALELAPGVEWRPHAAGGRVLTSEELLRFFAEFPGERELLEVVPYSFHEHGDQVLASGSFRLRGPGRISEFQIHIVYEFEQDRLVRGSTYATRAAALEAMGVSDL